MFSLLKLFKIFSAIAEGGAKILAEGLGYLQTLKFLDLDFS